MRSERLMVAGIGTDIGKTVVSAILTVLFDANYWKPIQCGEEKDWDSNVIKTWVGSHHIIYPSSHSFHFPVSPHQAAHLSGIAIDCQQIKVPHSDRTLIIEGVGGILVPLNNEILSLDLFKQWNCRWIVVSNHYIGSINHTLLTIETLKCQGIDLLGLVFNGYPNPDTENVILKKTKLPLLGNLYPEPILNKSIIKKYANLWTTLIRPLILA